MKNIFLLTAPLLILGACSQPAADSGNANNADTPDAAAIAANTRADGSVIDESRPHAHGDTAAHNDTMNMAIMAPAAGDSEATRDSKAAMIKMMSEMPAYTGDADVDFNKQMRGHHVAALEMAEVELKHGRDPASLMLAREIIAAQRREIAQIDAWLAERGQ